MITWQDAPSPATPLDADNLNTLASLTEAINTVAASGSALTLPGAQATLHDVTLTANCTLTFPAATSGSSFTLVLRQDSTGSRLVTWPTVKWSAGVAPTLTTNGVDIVTFTAIANTWYGFTAGLDMR